MDPFLNGRAHPSPARPTACVAIAALACAACFSSSSASSTATTEGGIDATAPAQEAAASVDAPEMTDAADVHVEAAPATDASDAAADAVASDASGDAGLDSGPDVVDATAPVVPLVTGTYAAGAAWGPSAGGYPGGIWGGQTLTFDPSGGLLGIANASWSLSTTVPLAEYGADGLVAWGRWAAGTTNISGSPAPTSALNYIAGIQAPSVGVLHATYAVFASTAPTALSGGNTLVGTTNMVTGSVSVSSGMVMVALDHITVGGHTFAIAGSAGFYATTGMLVAGTVTSGDGGCATACAGDITSAGAVQGWFLGASGERAAINFGFSSSVGDVSGAVVLR
jgi:hypothetical protein